MSAAQAHQGAEPSGRLTQEEREQLVRDLQVGKWTPSMQAAWKGLPPEERMLVLAARQALEAQWESTVEPRVSPDPQTVQRCLTAATEAQDLLLTAVERCLSMRLLTGDTGDQVLREVAAVIAAMEKQWLPQ